jgi:hypothetical protein
MFEAGMLAAFGAVREAAKGGDDHLVHVADVKGCPIATHARLRKRPMLTPSIATRVKWQLGHAGENIIATALRPQLVAKGYTVETDVLLWMSTFNGRVWSGRLDREAYPTRLVTTGGQLLIPQRTIVGHADLVAHRIDDDGDISRLLLEAKTEKRKLQSEPSLLHATQARTYAIMDAGQLPIGSCIVGIIDRRDGDYLFHDVALSDEARADILRRAEMALAMHASEPPAGAGPLIPSMCSWCDYGGCAQNKNAERLSLEGIF